MTDEEKLIELLNGGADFEMHSMIRGCLHPDHSRLVFSRNADRFRVFNWPIVFHKTPLVSLRQTAWKSALQEMQWFLSGSNDINRLPPKTQKWWEPWATTQEGVAGKFVRYNYSEQFRSYKGTFDQVETWIKGITEHPYSTRNCGTLWDSEQMNRSDCKITNCHGSWIQFSVDPLSNELSMLMVQRSCDVICGVPHNWIQYWAFLLWMAHRTGKAVGEFHWCGVDVHVYKAHLPIARKMLNTDLTQLKQGCELVYKPTSLDFLAEDFSLQGEYRPLLTEKVEMIV